MNHFSILSERRRSFFDLAHQCANKSLYGKIHHGAILVKNGNVISTGFNRADLSNRFGSRFRNEERKGPATIHAELDAIFGISSQLLRNADLYVVRVNKNGDRCLSKPCPMCEAALKFCGLYRAFWSVSSEEFDSFKLNGE